MSQRIYLVNIWDSSVWTNTYVELQTHTSDGVFIELSGKTTSGTVVNKEITNVTENKIRMKLEKNMQELQVVVRFDPHNSNSNHESSWCDNIEVLLDYGM